MGNLVTQWSVCGQIWGTLSHSGLYVDRYGEPCHTVVCVWTDMGNLVTQWSVCGQIWGTFDLVVI